MSNYTEVFVRNGEYGRVFDHNLVHIWAYSMRKKLLKEAQYVFRPYCYGSVVDDDMEFFKAISGIRVWDLQESILKNYHKHKKLSNKELYKKYSDIIIRNYKKNNRGKTSKKANKLIRSFLKNELQI